MMLQNHHSCVTPVTALEVKENKIKIGQTN
jgi:hypothetical protein